MIISPGIFVCVCVCMHIHILLIVCVCVCVCVWRENIFLNMTEDYYVFFICSMSIILIKVGIFKLAYHWVFFFSFLFFWSESLSFNGKIKFISMHYDC